MNVQLLIVAKKGSLKGSYIRKGTTGGEGGTR